MSYVSLISDVARLLGMPADRTSAIKLESCVTGGNNRVYVVSLHGRRLVVKQYFSHPSDRRDRLRAEQAFLKYAEVAGISCVPRVIACSTEHGFGVYEYIEGRRLQGSDVSEARLWEAAAFFLKLNDSAHRTAAEELSAASEACFSVEEHFAMVDLRIARLTNIPATAEIDLAAQDFVRELASYWNRVKSHIASKADRLGQELAGRVIESCISPSDFGFHNALVRTSGELCFLDFEYAGRDDPAKMVGDFFSHPAVPVPAEHFEEFVRVTMSFSPHARLLETRSRLLFPVFQTKWCCIILNDFLPEDARRRKFADPTRDEAAHKRGQLDKARERLNSIQT